MKNILSVLLIFISLTVFGQQSNISVLKMKSGQLIQVNIISIEKDKLYFETEKGKSSVISDVVESIDGMSYEEYYKENKDNAYSNVKFPLNDAGEIEYSEVVQVEGVSANELYVRVKEWLALTFVSSKSVIQLEDKEAGKIIGKGRSEILGSLFSGGRIYSYGYIDFTLEIQVKEGRYKYYLNNIVHDFEGQFGVGGSMISYGNLLDEPKSFSLTQPTKKIWDIIRISSDKKIRSIINSMKEKIKSNSDRTTDDW